MDRTAAQAELEAWAEDRRASDEARGPLVRDAYAAGMTKQEIHAVTGLARTTINDILREGIMTDILRERTRARERPDEFYLDARNKVLAAVEGLPKRADHFRTSEGVDFRIQRKMPLRIFLLALGRRTPGEEGRTHFYFERNGRVSVGGNRKVPLHESMARGHEPWASRSELEELAAQIAEATTVTD